VALEGLLLSSSEMTISPRTRHRMTMGAVVAAFLLVYGRMLADLAKIWVHDENYSHGLVVLPVIGYLVWRSRARLAATERRPSTSGLGIVAVSLAVLLVGTAGVEFFLMRTSAIGVLVGIVVFLGGWPIVRVLLFPLALTAFLIPLPPVVFYQIAFPLQLMATKFGVLALEVVRIPVLREGNVIALAHTTLEVTEACSGIRSLLALFALAAMYGYFADSRPVPRLLIAVSSIPIAIIANGLRIAGTGIAAHYIGPSVATGFFHAFSGWTIFMTSFVMLMAVSNAVKALPWPIVAAVRPEPSFS
jgi:exosortase